MKEALEVASVLYMTDIGKIKGKLVHGVGVAMLRRIPLLENKKGFLVFGFCFLGSKTVLCFQKIFATYYHISMSRFLIDMKYISKIFEILFDGSSSCFGARLSEKCQNVGFPKFRYL